MGLSLECIEVVSAALKIQSVWRGHKAGKLFKKQLRVPFEAAVKIQKVWRGYKTWKRFHKLLKFEDDLIEEEDDDFEYEGSLTASSSQKFQVWMILGLNPSTWNWKNYYLFPLLLLFIVTQTKSMFY